jgi:hypothetical protein
MSKRIPTGITRNYLESVALPNHGGRYTPISHKSIIDEELTARGFNVETELYRASIGGNVANGMYILDQGTDPDMKMMFVWGNSYDKSMRFKCGIGVYIPKTGNYIFAGNLSSYARKHTGKADEEAIQMIQTQLNMANAHYADLLASRDMLINHTGTLRTYSELVGRMFIEKQCLNKEQASTVRDRLIAEVNLLDNNTWDNAWNFYNSVATALRMSHPKNWFEDQAECHKLINSYFALATLTDGSVQDHVQQSVQEPDNQLSIFDTIVEVETVRALTSLTDVIVDELPQELFEQQPEESLPAHMADLPEEVQEQMYTDDILEEKTLSGKVNPDEDFFNFGDAELPVFDLPDL